MNSLQSSSFDRIFKVILDSLPSSLTKFHLDDNGLYELEIFSEKSGISIDSVDIFRKLAALLILNRLRFLVQYESRNKLKNSSVQRLSEFLKKKYPLIFISSPIESIGNLSNLLLSNSLMNSIEDILEHIPDMISKFYLEVVNQKIRRKMGQFWTPENIANLMVELAFKKSPKNILDPCTGPGTFLNVIHKKFPNYGYKISAIEIHPFLYELAAVNLHDYNLEMDLIYGDFLETRNESFKNGLEGTLAFMPPKHLDSFFKRNKSKGFDCVICNPPYSRHHVVSNRIKKKLGNEIEETFGDKFNRISSLFMYFILKSLKFLLMNGNMIFITPTIVFESRNSSYLKKILKRNFRIPYIIVFDESLNVFSGVDTAACIFMVEGKVPYPFDETKLLIVKSEVSNDEIIEFLFRDTKGKTVNSNNLCLYVNSQEKLDYDSNWTNPRSFVKNDTNTKLVKVSDFFKVMRGVATGNNMYFTLSDRELEEYKIKKEFVVPTLTRTRYVQKYIFTKEDFNDLNNHNRKSWLLYIEKDRDHINDFNLQKYLDLGIDLNVHKGSLVKSRKIWYRIEKRDIPLFIFTYLSRGFPRFILNEAGVRPLNTFLIIYPIKNITISMEFKLIFWAILNSTPTMQSLKEVGRCYGGDTFKIEPKELMKGLILNAYQISKESKSRLLEFAEELKLINRNNLSNKESIIKKIDDIVRDELNTK